VPQAQSAAANNRSPSNANEAKITGMFTASLLALAFGLYPRAADAQWAHLTGVTAQCNDTAQLGVNYGIVGTAAVSAISNTNPGAGHSMVLNVNITAFPWQNPCTAAANTNGSATATGQVITQQLGYFNIPMDWYEDAQYHYTLSPTPQAHCVLPPVCQVHPESCGQTPIIIPVHALPGGPTPDGNQGNQIHLTDAEHGVVFDINGNGQPEQIAWTADDQAGFLAVDRDGDGLITSGKELFGNNTLPGISNGWEALHDLMDVEGGVFKVGDKNFDKMLIWVDRNHNGFSEPDELIPASSVITAITTGAQHSGKKDKFGNQFAWMGKAKYVGQSQDDVSPAGWRPVYDVTLRTLP
jgi:hypothetical protein